MPYWDIIGRAFRISWQHKYLWLIAFFSGESAGSFGSNYNYNFSQGQSGTIGARRTPDLGAVQSQVSAWVHDNLGLLATVAVLWLLLVIGFFIFGAACEGATVRASAEHDAERPFDLSSAWQAGVARMWVIVRFRLLLFALALPAVLLVGVLVFATVFSAIGGHSAVAVISGLLAALVILLSIPYFIYLSFLDRFGSRAAVLDLVGARASLARAHHLLFKRLGRSLLVWLLSIAIGIGTGIVVGVVGAILVIPLLALIYLAASGGVSWIWVVLLGLVAIPFLLVAGAFLSALMSTYWTLAFRRLDVEYPPAYAYPPQPAPQP